MIAETGSVIVNRTALLTLFLVQSGSRSNHRGLALMNGCRNQTSLSFAEWYHMELLLVAISLFHPGDSHTLRQTEDLNLKIGTATSVTCGCTSRLLTRYSKKIGMYWNGLKRKEIKHGSKERNNN